MRVFLVVDETPFFHPDFVSDLVRRLHAEDEIVGAALVMQIPKSSNIERYFRRNLSRLEFSEIARMGLSRTSRRLMAALLPKGWNGGHFSVRNVLRRRAIPFVEARANINAEPVLDFIRRARPDVIVSSNSLIFKRSLLELPRLCCINRHTALLPAFKGILPAFHAVARGEKETGVSIHTMTEAIDEGVVLTQWKTPIGKGDTLWSLYKRCFEASASLVVQALDKIRRGDMTGEPPSKPPSYYSFPTAEDWRAFRANGGRFI